MAHIRKSRPYSGLGFRAKVLNTFKVVPSSLGRGTGNSRRMHDEEREFFIDNLLVRIHLIIEIILVDRPCAMGV